MAKILHHGSAESDPTPLSPRFKFLHSMSEQMNLLGKHFEPVCLPESYLPFAGGLQKKAAFEQSTEWHGDRQCSA